MGFFGSIVRFIRTLFGLAEGSTERATDALLSASPDAIHSQFRKTRDDLVRDYNEMKDAIAELCSIRDQRLDEIGSTTKEINSLTVKMAGAIETYKKNNDVKLRDAYGRFATRQEQLTVHVSELNREVQEQSTMIEAYKARLTFLQESIENLKKEEAETVADIVSSRKIVQLNDKLKGLSTDTQSKNIEAIREARLKLKSSAKLSAELSGTDAFEMENKLITAGQSAVHFHEFDDAVKIEQIFGAEPKQLPEAVKQPTVQVEDKFEALFK